MIAWMISMGAISANYVFRSRAFEKRLGMNLCGSREIA
jgi:hypothetical protein